MPDVKIYDLLEVNCNVGDAFDFNLSKATPVAVIENLSFSNSGIKLDQDLDIPDPLDPNSRKKVAAIIQSCKWDGDPTDPFVIRGKVSSDGKSNLQKALNSLTGGLEIELELKVMSYDKKAKKYFARADTDGTPLKFVITRGTKVYVEEESDEQELHAFSMSFTPKKDPKPQQICIATSLTDKLTYPVGGTVSTA